MAAMATKFIALVLSMTSLSTGFILPGAQLSTKPGPSHCWHMMSTRSGTVDNSRTNLMEIVPMTSSLASSYAIRIIYPSNNIEGECNELKWELHSLSHWEQPNQGEGTLALHALSDCSQLDGRADAVCTLTCQWTTSDLADSSLANSNSNADACWSINVAAVKEDVIVPRELVCVLSRIMVQSVATSQIASKVREKETTLLRITLPLLEGEGCQKMLLSDLFPTDERGLPNNNSGVRHLFTPLNSHYANMEIVDMVNQDGQVLGSLPRPYIHTWNILHRGIGMIVSKDVDIFKAFKSGKTPHVYVHQRTSTKRIFPSLFDMFVGGVSSSGEDAQWTAAREVAEELGLKRALDALENKEEDQISINPLSEKLFQCTVCTSYNRCVVSMFTYTCDTALESITWQEEEVAWGDYVPYDIVKLAGEMSIDRLVEKGVWPGSGCHNEESVSDVNDAQRESTIEELKNKYGNNQSWDTWDFVPDGLLVWEAWESFLSQKG